MAAGNICGPICRSPLEPKIHTMTFPLFFSSLPFPPQYVCLQDVAQELLGQTASPGAAASMVVAATSGQGLVSVLLVLLAFTATQVS